MHVHDLSVYRIYTDGKGRWRQIDEFFDDFDGRRRVQYVHVYFNDKLSEWLVFGVVKSCSKESFARWAKTKVTK